MTRQQVPADDSSFDEAAIKSDFDRRIEPNRPPNRTSRELIRLWPLLALIPVALQLFLSLHHLRDGWDDAAITTAFSQTWAQTGRIALTPTSPVVEGYSSFSWFVLLAIPFLFTPSPDAAIAWMKILSALFFLLSLRFIYLIALREFGTKVAAAASVLLLAFCYTPLQEIESGMEMNFAAFLLLLLFHLLTRKELRGRFIAASVVGCVLLATRFEMPYTLFFLFCGLIWSAFAKRPGRFSFKSVLGFGLILLISFAVMELCRHRYFGLWMPNTVYAKRFVPYRDWSTKRNIILTRWAATMEIVYIFGLPLLLLAIALVYSIRRRTLSATRSMSIHPGVWSIALGSLLFGIVFGQNWGYPGRMTATMLPFLILALVALCVIAFPAGTARHRLLGTLVVTQILFWIFFTAHPTFAVTPISIVEPLGEGADEIRNALNKDHLTILMADVGGSALYHKQLTVLDSGLLTSPTLAQTGWTGFAPYFQQVAPEVVEIHSLWALHSHAYSLGLLDHYSLVAANGIRFFVRDDLYQQLREQHPDSVKAATIVPACIQLSGADREVSLQKGTCLVLNNPLENNNLP